MKKHTKPLPELLRPQCMTQFIGQQQLIEQIQSLINRVRLPSILLYGPPGCGKSTLALLLAQTKTPNVTRISAPEVGLQQLRQYVETTDILILDEIHRFSKTQQDFFLPILESGKLTLLATTTENPSFSITKQLLSRLHMLKLHALNYTDLAVLTEKAQTYLSTNIPTESIEFLITRSHGDARTLLNLIEHISTLPECKRDLESIKKHTQDMLLYHDKKGDSHYAYASALIKSIRGSDPDAALYYLACLLEGGEDPRFISRRLIISASEDIGLANPQALSIAVACQQAVEFIGMPEARIPLSETVIYLALAQKSNSTYAAYDNVSKEISRNGVQPVPIHLLNPSTQLQKQDGYGANYKYPHNYPDAWIEQEYLPKNITNRTFYHAKNIGEEPKLNAWVRSIQKRKTTSRVHL